MIPECFASGTILTVTPPCPHLSHLRLASHPRTISCPRCHIRTLAITFTSPLPLPCVDTHTLMLAIFLLVLSLFVLPPPSKLSSSVRASSDAFLPIQEVPSQRTTHSVRGLKFSTHRSSPRPACLTPNH